MSISETREKTAYAQPKLAVYGGFSQLTASGSSGLMENNVPGAPTRMA